jgi:hypothetical protein
MEPEVGIVGGAVTPLSSVAIFKKRVMLVYPWLKHVHPITSFCVSQLADKRRTSSMLNFGDAFVAHSRNTCADLFLKSDLEWMLTIDDDMLIPFGNSAWFNGHMGYEVPEPFSKFNAIDRLLSHGKTLVGALYFGRWKNGYPVYNEGKAEAEYVRTGPQDVCKPTRWVGTGCMMIHRSVFEDMEKRFPHLGRGPDGMGGHWFSTSEHNLLDHVHRTHKFLSAGPMTGEKALKAYEMLDGALRDAKRKSSLGMGEDSQFCIRAAESGHQPHVDLGLLCGHIGHHVYGPRKME